MLKEYEYCKKVMKIHFNKNLIMTEKEELPALSKLHSKSAETLNATGIFFLIIFNFNCSFF